MREVFVRFEGGSGQGADDAVRGTVWLATQVSRPPHRFDGWLQLLTLLEEFSLTSGDDEPQATRPGTARAEASRPVPSGPHNPGT